MGSLRVVTLDVGGTLLFPHPSVGEVYARILDQHGFEVSAERIEKRFMEIFRALRAEPRDHVSDESERLFWREVVRDVLESDVPEDRFEAVFAQLYEAFATADRWRLAGDALETVQALRRRGLQTAILSNADSRLRGVLEEMKVVSRMDSVFISAEIGWEKPDPRLFRHVESEMGFPPEAFLHVGDSHFHDGNGARAAGWEYLILDGELDPERRKISKLSDLPPLLGIDSLNE